METMRLLKETRRLTSVRIIWVKGHSGITGNEYADMLAKEGTKMAKDMVFVTPYIPIKHKRLKRQAHCMYLDHWNSLWQEYTA